jgi:hypothetical protein
VMVSSVCLSSEMYCCHYESHKIRWTSRKASKKAHVPPKHWLTFTKLDRITSLSQPQEPQVWHK